MCISILQFTVKYVFAVYNIVLCSVVLCPTLFANQCLSAYTVILAVVTRFCCCSRNLEVIKRAAGRKCSQCVAQATCSDCEACWIQTCVFLALVWPSMIRYCKSESAGSALAPERRLSWAGIQSDLFIAKKSVGWRPKCKMKCESQRGRGAGGWKRWLNICFLKPW